MVTSCVKLIKRLCENLIIVLILDECIPKLKVLANVFKLLKKEFEGIHCCLFFIINSFLLSVLDRDVLTIKFLVKEITYQILEVNFIDKPVIFFLAITESRFHFFDFIKIIYLIPFL